MRKLKLLCLCGLTAAVLMTGCAGSTDTMLTTLLPSPISGSNVRVNR